jgi:ribA/ribD-fused uncharacterized protein
MNAITDFHNEFYWLDNMYLVSINWSRNVVFTSTEQGFVYFKTIDLILREEILTIKDPYAAKAFGRSMPMRPDWDDIKYGVMYELVDQKFYQHMDLRKKLLATGNQPLLEGNTWHDNTWGDCFCQQCMNVRGDNFLGKTLMSIRAKYREKNMRSTRSNRRRWV